MIDRETIVARAQQIRNSLWTTREGEQTPRANNVSGAIQSTLTLLELVYGNPSLQVEQFMKRSWLGGSTEDKRGEMIYQHRVAQDIEQVLASALADLESGITSSIGIRAKGEILGDFIALARQALQERDSAADRVAAVLTAAALEETLKQLGEAKGVDVYKRDMNGVIQKLKDAGVLSGSQPGVARGYVNFRDAAFHGQFDQIERASTESALTFVEGILLEEFS